MFGEACFAAIGVVLIALFIHKGRHTPPLKITRTRHRQQQKAREPKYEQLIVCVTNAGYRWVAERQRGTAPRRGNFWQNPDAQLQATLFTWHEVLVNHNIVVSIVVDVFAKKQLLVAQMIPDALAEIVIRYIVRKLPVDPLGPLSSRIGSYSAKIVKEYAKI